MILPTLPPEICDLAQTINILLKLRSDAFYSGNMQGFTILRRTIQHVQNPERTRPRAQTGKAVRRKPASRRVQLRVAAPKKPAQIAHEIVGFAVEMSRAKMRAEAFQ